jgi:protein TonB
VEVDNLPEFPGGDAALLNYIATNTIYPASAKKNGIQGRVIVSFSVSEDGSVGRSRIVKSVDPEVDAEAIRVINSLPAFENPAIKNGNPVPVWYMVPITFKLK